MLKKTLTALGFLTQANRFVFMMKDLFKVFLKVTQAKSLRFVKLTAGAQALELAGSVPMLLVKISRLLPG